MAQAQAELAADVLGDLVQLVGGHVQPVRRLAPPALPCRWTIALWAGVVLGSLLVAVDPAYEADAVLSSVEGSAASIAATSARARTTFSAPIAASVAAVSRACCSALLIGTKRICGRLAASQGQEHAGSQRAGAVWIFPLRRSETAEFTAGANRGG